jgi:hypothetical protein
MLGVRALLALYPGPNPFNLYQASGIPRLGDPASVVTVDARVLTFSFVLSLLTGIAFGLLPALQASQGRAHDALKQTGSGSIGRRQRIRSALVAGEIAAALMLVVGAGLLIRTALALNAVQSGFAADHVLTMRMPITGTRFEKRDGIAELTRDGIARVRAIPGVVAASTTCCMPLETVWQLSFLIRGRPLPPGRPFHAFAGWTFV